MDPPTKTRCSWREKDDVGNTSLDVAPWEAAFEDLVTAMRTEFLRALATIDQLRLENRILRGKVGSCTGAAAQHLDEVETHTGAPGEFTGVVPGCLLSNEGPPTTPSPTSIAKGDKVGSSYGPDRLAQITGTEHKLGLVRFSVGTTVDAPTHKPPTSASSSEMSWAATSSADVEEGKVQNVHDVDHPAETRVDLGLDRFSRHLDVAPGIEGEMFRKRTIEDMRRVSSSSMERCGGRRHSNPAPSVGRVSSVDGLIGRRHSAPALSVRRVASVDGFGGSTASTLSRVVSRNCIVDWFVGRVRRSDTGDRRHSAGSDRRHSTGNRPSLMSVCNVWEQNPKPLLIRSSPTCRLLTHELTVTLTGVRAGDELKEDSILQSCVLRPWRPETWVWDIVVALVTTYDVIMVPLQVFPVTHVAMHALDLMTASVWTLDILVGFLRGRDIGGVLDLRPSTIAKKYLQTWFLPDLALVALDWVFIVADSTELNVVRSLRTRRAFRILRIMRVLRITKILLSIRRGQKNMQLSDYTKAFASVIKFLFTMWLVNHYVACGWYAIGDIGTEPNWIANNFVESDSISYRYSTAYHWSLTQFTPASMEVVPTNAVERAYSVGAIFFGLIMFTSFVSHMTNAVTRIQQLKHETDMQRLHLRNYVLSHKVSFDLGKKIETYVQTANKRMKSTRLLESDVTVLRMLPENLLRKLREEVHTPAVCVHPLFKQLQCNECSAFISICTLAAVEKNVLIGEELFRCGATATKMYFSTSGELSYYFEDLNGYTVDKVPERSWFSEATLWCNWTHKGRMMSSDDIAQVVTVNAADFHRIVSATASFYRVQCYAKMWCLISVDECGSKELMTDIWGGTHWVSMIVRRSWARSAHNFHSSRYNLQELYIDVFQHWKTHTTEAVRARFQTQGWMSVWTPRRG